MSKFDPVHLNIIDGNETIFSQDKYFIPLYQRAFAWGEDEIQQLIDDIYDFKAKSYYLGSLIVNQRQDGLYEVIDGQQRLTAIFLLLHYLGYHLDNDRLVYECRTKSNYTLNHLSQLHCRSHEEKLDADKIEDTLRKGIEDINKKFHNDSIDPEKFKEKLQKVRLFRIEVPPHTDLNRYFEIMNVRGEQLEQHDIVKANLMKQFDNNPDERTAFAKIWDACRDMSGYVQMHFSTKNNERAELFGRNWSGLYLDDFISKLNSNAHNVEVLTAMDIVNRRDGFEQPPDGDYEDGKQVRFDSIIDFPYFLLHVLKVFIGEDIANPRISLDDKKLVETFKGEIEKSDDAKKFSLDFIQCLLKCRFLFDKYIIKREREYKSDDKNGVWSLKEIHNYDGKALPISTTFKNKWEQDEIYKNSRHKERHGNILMLQSCLRVSDTSPKSMHWITLALKWLYDNDHIDKHANLEHKIEQYVQKRVADDFLQQKNYSMGIATPHLVLNYLDYLLWKREKVDFVFEFRNSIEHWYPQHPFSENNETWKKIDPTTTYDRFGNLCLLQRDTNSKFSNASPLSKQGYEKQINEGSLKLRAMSKKTTDNTKWVKEDCAEHEEEMLKLLREACGVEFIPNMG